MHVVSGGTVVHVLGVAVGVLVVGVTVAASVVSLVVPSGVVGLVVVFGVAGVVVGLVTEALALEVSEVLLEDLHEVLHHVVGTVSAGVASHGLIKDAHQVVLLAGCKSLLSGGLVLIVVNIQLLVVEL